jgi:hypothetical protein
VALEVGEDGVKATEGKVESPDLTAELSSEEMVRLVWGRYDVAEGVRSGSLRLSDPSLADALSALFPGR